MLEKEITALHFGSTETDLGEKGVKETKRCCGKAQEALLVHTGSFPPYYSQPNSWCNDGHDQQHPGEGSWDEALSMMGRMSRRKN